ncbi:MAG: hypothetical protein IPG83_02320 [Novosphingobium sp.]|nr:hypothetical protein [Novosphingobium sp.]
MTKIIALDLSKRSTGWAIWEAGWANPRYGSVQLGSEYTTDGGCYVKLHSVLRDLRTTLCRFESIYYEDPINAMALTGHTNADTLRVLSGLAAHACSFGHAMGIRVQAVNITSWRRHFVGKMPRGTKTKDWKDYAGERCRQYGWKPKNSDEADALGILDYAVSLEGKTPPWISNETLRAPLGMTA